MTATECNRFDSCNSPLCPRDGESLFNGIWYAGDEICQLQVFCHEPYIINQKKIVKQIRNVDFYFTYRMLQHSCVIGRGIEGLDPDHDLSEKDVDEDRWLKQHPEKRKLNETEKAERFLRMKRGLNHKKKL